MVCSANTSQWASSPRHVLLAALYAIYIGQGMPLHPYWLSYVPLKNSRLIWRVMCSHPHTLQVCDYSALPPIKLHVEWDQGKFPGISTFDTPFYTSGRLWAFATNNTIPVDLMVYNDVLMLNGADQKVRHWSWLPDVVMSPTRFLKVAPIYINNSFVDIDFG